MEETTYPACLGCGYCCKKVQCVVSLSKFGEKKKCPAIRFHDERYWCGIIEDAPEAAKIQYTQALNIGEGCSSSLNSDRKRKKLSK